MRFNDTAAHAVTVYAEHPGDVLAAWLEQHAAGGAALVVITMTQGGGIRAAGTLMSVSHAGARVGYVSGGCLDADVAAQSVAALSDGKARKLRYGAGSPFLDLSLPCGGALDVLILPRADPWVIRRCRDLLAGRSPAWLGFADSGEVAIDPPETMDHVFRYLPPVRLRIAGRGGDALALDRLARASGLPTLLEMREQDFHPAADQADRIYLKTSSSLPKVKDDPWTAVILSFHDDEWEDPLLLQALDGPAFFIGAVGSRRTHELRCGRLRAQGIEERQIARIRSPVGLIASMRDASSLAISILAEIVSCSKTDLARPLPTRP